MIQLNRRSSDSSVSESFTASDPILSSTDGTLSSTFDEETTVISLNKWKMMRENNLPQRTPMQSRTGNEIMECVEGSDCSEYRVLDNEETRELLQHYLDNSESVDDLKLYKINFRVYIRQLFGSMVDFVKFIFILCSSDNFWSTCLMILHVVLGVFFYLILAVSAILITVVLGLHNALLHPNSKEDKENAQPENAATCLSPSDLETFTIQPTKKS